MSQTELCLVGFKWLHWRRGKERRMKWNEKKEEGGWRQVSVCVCVCVWGGGVVAEMRENLYQADQPSVLLQSPDKAGTAGGETMCIKTSWRSMASFCQLWKRQKRARVRNKAKKKKNKTKTDYLSWSTGMWQWAECARKTKAARSQGGMTEGHNQDEPGVFMCSALRQTAERQVISAIGA